MVGCVEDHAAAKNQRHVWLAMEGVQLNVLHVEHTSSQTVCVLVTGIQVTKSEAPCAAVHCFLFHNQHPEPTPSNAGLGQRAMLHTVYSSEMCTASVKLPSDCNATDCTASATHTELVL